MKKKYSSLHSKKIINNIMQRIALHIETAKGFSPNSDYPACGACMFER